jgi:hypothetical protein
VPVAVGVASGGTAVSVAVAVKVATGVLVLVGTAVLVGTGVLVAHPPRVTVPLTMAPSVLTVRVAVTFAPTVIASPARVVPGAMVKVCPPMVIEPGSDAVAAV